MTTAEFLNLLEERGIMPPMQVNNLRQQVSGADYGVHPIRIARRLVEEGYLNPYFAKTLLAERSPPSSSSMNDGLSPLGEMPEDLGLEDLPEMDLDDMQLPPIAGDDWLSGPSSISGSQLSEFSSSREGLPRLLASMMGVDEDESLPIGFLSTVAVGVLIVLGLVIWMIFD